LLINHNTWTYLDAFKRANDLFENGHYERIPPEYIQCVEIVSSVLARPSVSSAIDELERHQKFLDDLAPMTM